MPDPTPEQWRPIPGYEGTYEASDHGRIRSLRRGHPQLGEIRKVKVLKGNVNKSGYPFVNLYRDGKPKSTYIHHAVMLAFVGPPPEGLEIRHLNGDPGDNRLANLQYGTHSENMRDTVRHGTNLNAIKTTCPRGHAYDRFYDGGPGHSHRWCSTCQNEWRRNRK